MYCPYCQKNVVAEVLERVDRLDVCSKTRNVKFKYAYCSECLSQLYDKNLANENLLRHAKLYKED